jgi:hypothetical protein
MNDLDFIIRSWIAISGDDPECFEL